MFLKAYLNISDEKLVDRYEIPIGTYSHFVGSLMDNQRIKDKAIVSRIRSYVAEHTDWQELQHVLLNHWKGDMDR